MDTISSTNAARMAATKAALTPPVRAAIAQLSSLSAGQLATLAQITSALATMSNPILITQLRAADGSLNPVEITLQPGMMLTTDAGGNLTQSAIPAVPAERVGDIPLPASNVVGATGIVTFSSPMPTADYVLEVFNNNNAGALKWTKAQAGFTYTILTPLGNPFSYHAVQKL